uniref:Uncharacterized protein n=1 Tax=Lepeophtheirus salmonis TaxID=72036 RepID=A0A0K2UCX3_LEPSM
MAFVLTVPLQPCLDFLATVPWVSNRFSMLYSRLADPKVVGNIGWGLPAPEYFQHKKYFGFHFVVFEDTANINK